MSDDDDTNSTLTGTHGAINSIIQNDNDDPSISIIDLDEVQKRLHYEAYLDEVDDDCSTIPTNNHHHRKDDPQHNHNDDRSEEESRVYISNTNNNNNNISPTMDTITVEFISGSSDDCEAFVLGHNNNHHHCNNEICSSVTNQCIRDFVNCIVTNNNNNSDDDKQHYCSHCGELILCAEQRITLVLDRNSKIYFHNECYMNNSELFVGTRNNPLLLLSKTSQSDDGENNDCYNGGKTSFLKDNNHTIHNVDTHSSQLKSILKSNYNNHNDNESLPPKSNKRSKKQGNALSRFLPFHDKWYKKISSSTNTTTTTTTTTTKSEEDVSLHQRTTSVDSSSQEEYLTVRKVARENYANYNHHYHHYHHHHHHQELIRLQEQQEWCPVMEYIMEPTEEGCIETCIYPSATYYSEDTKKNRTKTNHHHQPPKNMIQLMTASDDSTTACSETQQNDDDDDKDDDNDDSISEIKSKSNQNYSIIRSMTDFVTSTFWGMASNNHKRNNNNHNNNNHNNNNQKCPVCLQEVQWNDKKQVSFQEMHFHKKCFNMYQQRQEFDSLSCNNRIVFDDTTASSLSLSSFDSKKRMTTKPTTTSLGLNIPLMDDDDDNSNSNCNNETAQVSSWSGNNHSVQTKTNTNNNEKQIDAVFLITGNSQTKQQQQQRQGRKTNKKERKQNGEPLQERNRSFSSLPGSSRFGFKKQNDEATIPRNRSCSSMSGSIRFGLGGGGGGAHHHHHPYRHQRHDGKETEQEHHDAEAFNANNDKKNKKEDAIMQNTMEDRNSTMKNNVQVEVSEEQEPNNKKQQTEIQNYSVVEMDKPKENVEPKVKKTSSSRNNKNNKDPMLVTLEKQIFDLEKEFLRNKEIKLYQEESYNCCHHVGHTPFCLVDLEPLCGRMLLAADDDEDNKSSRGSRKSSRKKRRMKKKKKKHTKRWNKKRIKNNAAKE